MICKTPYETLDIEQHEPH